MPGSMHGIVWKCGKIRDGCSEMIIKSVLRRTLTPFLKGRFYTFSSLLPGHLSKVVLPRPHCRLNTRLPKAIPVKSVSTDAEGASTNVRLADNAETRELEPGLYVVATPIGNLEDITLRALRVLKSASVILAEDTRHSQKLLSFYGIQTRTVSFHEHNEREKESKVCSFPSAGKTGHYSHQLLHFFESCSSIKCKMTIQCVNPACDVGYGSVKKRTGHSSHQ